MERLKNPRVEKKKRGVGQSTSLTLRGKKEKVPGSDRWQKETQEQKREHRRTTKKGGGTGVNQPYGMYPQGEWKEWKTHSPVNKKKKKTKRVLKKKWGPEKNGESINRNGNVSNPGEERNSHMKSVTQPLEKVRQNGSVTMGHILLRKGGSKGSGSVIRGKKSLGS